jgi:hypothetical protein
MIKCPVQAGRMLLDKCVLISELIIFILCLEFLLTFSEVSQSARMLSRYQVTLVQTVYASIALSSVRNR